VGKKVKDIKVGDHVGVGCLSDSCLDCKNCAQVRNNTNIPVLYYSKNCDSESIGCLSDSCLDCKNCAQVRCNIFCYFIAARIVTMKVLDAYLTAALTARTVLR
jgi:Zn-dependent alcohol dehydrogenase